MKRPRFTLQTLLIGSTLMMIPTAWFGLEFRESNRQSQIAFELAQLGAHTQSEGTLLPRLTVVSAWDCDEADQLLNRLEGCSELKSLTIQASSFDNESLRHLAGLPHLESVDLSWTSVSDRGLEHLSKNAGIKNLVLNKLHCSKSMPQIGRWQITDRGIEAIAKLPQLKKLILWGAELTGASIESLATTQSLETLWLIDARLTGKRLGELCQLPRLQFLDVSDNEVDATDIEPFREKASLTQLVVARTLVTPEEANRFYISRQGSFSIGY